MVTVPDSPTGLEFPENALLSFTDSSRPPLPGGLYTITAAHHLERTTGHGGATTTTTEAVGTATSTTLHVAGPRFSLPGNDIHAVYPPDGSSGAFATVLPHVVLERETLPWERAAEVVDEAGSSPPWLAVLVLRPDEILTSTTVPAAGLLAGSATPPTGFSPLTGEPGDAEAPAVRLIELEASVAGTVLPDAATLGLLTHVRRVELPDGSVESARALTTATRFPADGLNVAHLVSLEHQYTGGWHTAGPAGGSVHLISLFSWAFTAQDDQEHEFAPLAGALEVEPLALTAPAGVPEAFVGQLAVGSVPVEHRLDDGTRTAAWYRGPLLSGPAPTAELPLPDDVRHARELLLLDAGTGLVDVSYAAAWELGRLLALQEPGVATALNAWRRGTEHHDRVQRQRDAHPQAGVPEPAEPQFDLGPWFTHRLDLLDAVPFGYLVADPGLLTPESIRPFRVDAAWIRCLRAGAAGLGRSRTAVPPLPDQQDHSGFLLRSRLVQDFPGLIVDAYRGGERDAADRADPARLERLAPDVLLALYPGAVDLVDLRLHPQVLHAGFDSKEEAAERMRDPQSRVFEPGAVRGAATAAQLAWEIIDRVPRVSLRLGVPS